MTFDNKFSNDALHFHVLPNFSSPLMRPLVGEVIPTVHFPQQMKEMPAATRFPGDAFDFERFLSDLNTTVVNLSPPTRPSKRNLTPLAQPMISPRGCLRAAISRFLFRRRSPDRMFCAYQCAPLDVPVVLPFRSCEYLFILSSTLLADCYAH